ncbi:MAG: acyl-CoA desaturase [Methylicorpusculum sp.]|uniref:acyl-CoA desaturase n=1 Tax=Methylicorpusculum sp. TaxID=2713644 RepID=UPI002728E426|nr:acyl-CoA desaturase [Methylicorpusculum sp.]MDO8937690.1 acyl-CoA desaturase [Methylicorpusculum sp.]MDO9241530.1 acyl-CoA desaturase [Methylicorpusculum sp.]MDP2201631.1 acyl-CoA desaturase [Methylicorpusculum sp.]
MQMPKPLIKFLSWFDNSHVKETDNVGEAIDWLRVIPFVLMHLACLFVLVVGCSPIALWVAFFSYGIRMFAITAFYHRYFSHKAFKTSRVCQFLFALLGATATQRGPIWWASHHRRHHRYSDKDQDIHSPRHGFLWSHMGWFLCLKHFNTRESWVRDLLKYPELRWLDRFDIIMPILYAFGLLGLGNWLGSAYPELNTSGWQMVIWGYFISSVVLIHCTLFVNSLAHVWGNQRYVTEDDSRNNLFIALVTLGEGWHNNHHHYPVSARQGFFWWEIDISYYILKLMAMVGLIWDLQPVPKNRLTSDLIVKESSI